MCPIATTDGTPISALSLGAAGVELARLERHAEAAAVLQRALAALGEGAGLGNPAAAGKDDAVLLRAQWQATLAACRLELGPCADAEPALVQTLAALGDCCGAGEGAIAAPSTPVRTASAAAHFALARIRIQAGHLTEARADLEAASAALEGLPVPLSQARTDFLLGGVLARCGELPRALELWRLAGERLANGDLHGEILLRARLAMNRGIALAELGRHREASAALREALVLFDGLVLAGRPHARMERARALRNLGFSLGRANEHEESVAALERARHEASESMRSAASGAARLALRITRGGALSSMGYSLFVLGRYEEARQTLRRALRDLGGQAAASAQQRDETARARINLAHVETHSGRHAAADRLFRRAAEHFAKRVAEGEGDAYAADHVNAELGRARVAVRRGRHGDATATFAPAMAQLAALTRQGRLQHEALWLAAWEAQRAACFEVLDSAQRRASQAREEALVHMLQAALADPPHHAAGLGPQPWLALAAAARQTFSTAQPLGRPSNDGHLPAGSHASEAVATAHLRYLLGWACALLVEHDPAWVREQRNEVDAAIEALRENAGRRLDTAAQLAQWFLATRGLRAQRAVLADSDEPELAELRALLRELHRIEQEILGARGNADGEPGPVGAPRAAAAPAHLPPTAGTPPQPAMLHAWQQLSARTRAMRSELVTRGLLPPVQALDFERVRAAVAPGAALLLLARPQRDTLLVIVLARRPGAVASVSHHSRRLAAALLPFSCAELHALARAPWATSARPGLAEGDRFALALFEQLWLQSVEPIARALAGDGVGSVDIVPSGDLHLAPWNHLAASSAAGRTRVFPSAAAWWRSRTQPDDAPPMHEARWACVAAPAATIGSAELRWADVERRLSAKLWGERMQPMHLDSSEAARDEEADALLGVGHGMVEQANAARVGLLVGEGATLLRPHHLLRLRRCRQALLSACLLGHTDGRSGEALGFLSGCFDHGLRHAAGWLTEVADEAACLYSLAAQWALKASEVSADADARFSDALAALRRQLLQGSWPGGFGTWLRGEWPADAPGAAPQAPPSVLLQALPWAVTLG